MCISVFAYEIIETRFKPEYKTGVKFSHIGKKKVINEEKIWQNIDSEIYTKYSFSLNEKMMGLQTPSPENLNLNTSLIKTKFILNHDEYWEWVLVTCKHLGINFWIAILREGSDSWCHR